MGDFLLTLEYYLRLDCSPLTRLLLLQNWILEEAPRVEAGQRRALMVELLARWRLQRGGTPEEFLYRSLFQEFLAHGFASPEGRLPRELAPPRERAARVWAHLCLRSLIEIQPKFDSPSIRTLLTGYLCRR
jgi:hypothetical protein